MRVDSRVLIALFPMLIILGKVVRWTVMRGTLINYSKGWGLVEPIMQGDWNWQFFGLEEVTEGNIGQGDNVITFFKALWTTIWMKLPATFEEFEIFITVTFGILFVLVLLGMRRRLPLVEAVCICLACGVMSVYCLCLSKEPFQMVFFLLMYAVLHSDLIPERQKLYWGYGVVLLSACCFRTYYTLILVFAIACQWYLGRMRRRARPRRQLGSAPMRWTSIAQLYLLAVVVYFAMMAVFSVANGQLYDRFQDTLLYASEASGSSNTYIENALSINEDNPNILSVTAEYALVILRLLFPVELVGNGPKYWPYIIYQLCMTVFLLRGLRNCRTNTRAQNAALIIFLGYVFASAAFEVDFGSWVRHCAVTTPVVLVLSGICPTAHSRATEGERLVEQASQAEMLTVG
ncbi:hypothetical protein B5F79_06505 [Olsenella sp. An285]|nr:hypothetical protein B5F79_06505 [Olsenella sp. An285]